MTADQSPAFHIVPDLSKDIRTFNGEEGNTVARECASWNCQPPTVTSLARSLHGRNRAVTFTRWRSTLVIEEAGRDNMARILHSFYEKINRRR